VDAAQALADLTEISSQIQAAVLAGAEGSVVASTFREAEQGKALAKAAVELVSAAGEIRGDGPQQELVQIQAATPRGSVFVVRDGSNVVAAITGSKPTVGLVFYDLKTCLRMLETEGKKAQKAEKAEPAAMTEKAEKAEKAAPKETKVGKATTRRRTTSKKEDDESS
jgi:predicted regulator of Ras-like GTPase activity (Roadblock/LC7/MglB family)